MEKNLLRQTKVITENIFISKYPFSIRELSIEEGGGFFIEFPDLPGCISNGETIEETIHNGHDAVNCWLETAKLIRKEIPEI